MRNAPVLLRTRLGSFSLVAIQACATQSANFELNDVQSGEVAVTGRLSVRYNGVTSTAGCKACFNDSSVCVVPDPKGYVFHHFPAGSNFFGEIRCTRDASDYSYRFTPHRFWAPPGKVTYIGDLFVEWSLGDPENSAEQLGVGASVIDVLGNEGEAKLEVRDQRDDVFRKFTAQTGSRGPFHVSLAAAEKK